ncbi:hypothetical protein ColLi_02759 [Colletotrichum liriopes]|uniref:Uncharacterized protein n=1 Tax=Colletotrichum liriopes TaxID=708192 RepID=A0AA37GFD9_9PEZI|nr:hypothetical protein ColLi_02759 [Colletotrichum liriopes]
MTLPKIAHAARGIENLQKDRHIVDWGIEALSSGELFHLCKQYLHCHAIVQRMMACKRDEDTFLGLEHGE